MKIVKLNPLQKFLIVTVLREQCPEIPFVMFQNTFKRSNTNLMCY